jgi:hypothetical protein
MPRLLVSPRYVVGYHGCTVPIADAILAVGGFPASENRYDWLGRGIYFWEYAPYRALELARYLGLQRGEEAAVLQATIRLGKCVNLMDVKDHADLLTTYNLLIEFYGEENLPSNTARGGHFRDRLVIDTYCDQAAAQGASVDAVRGTFPEGEPIYPGSMILSLAHTQIAVRNPDCITNLRLVRFERGGTQ